MGSHLPQRAGRGQGGHLKQIMAVSEVVGQALQLKNSGLNKRPRPATDDIPYNLPENNMAPAQAKKQHIKQKPSEPGGQRTVHRMPEIPDSPLKAASQPDTLLPTKLIASAASKGIAPLHQPSQPCQRPQQHQQSQQPPSEVPHPPIQSRQNHQPPPSEVPQVLIQPRQNPRPPPSEVPQALIQPRQNPRPPPSEVPQPTPLAQPQQRLQSQQPQMINRQESQQNGYHINDGDDEVTEDELNQEHSDGNKPRSLVSNEGSDDDGDGGDSGYVSTGRDEDMDEDMEYEEEPLFEDKAGNAIHTRKAEYRTRGPDGEFYTKTVEYRVRCDDIAIPDIDTSLYDQDLWKEPSQSPIEGPVYYPTHGRSASQDFDQTSPSEDEAARKAIDAANEQDQVLYSEDEAEAQVHKTISADNEQDYNPSDLGADNGEHNENHFEEPAYDEYDHNHAAQSRDVLDDHHSRNRSNNAPNTSRLAAAASHQAQLIADEEEDPVAEEELEPEPSKPRRAQRNSSGKVQTNPMQKLSSYPATWTTVITRTKVEFCRNTFLIEAFPLIGRSLKYASAVLAKEIADARAIGMLLDPAYAQCRDMDIIVFHEASTYRLKLKNMAVPLVRTYYASFLDPDFVGNQLHLYQMVKDNVATLFHKDLYLKNGVDKEGRTNNMSHKCIRKLCIEFFYSGDECLAALHPEDFKDSIPEYSFALVMTCIRNCLDEYKDNGYTEVGRGKQFDRRDYKTVLDGIQAAIQETKKDPYHSKKMQKNLANWASTGMERLDPTEKEPIHHVSVELD